MAGLSVEASRGGVCIRVRVQPKASRDAVLVDADGRIRVALTAPPVDGAANTALIKYMAKFLGVKRRLLSLQAGERSREKTLFLEAGSLEVVRSRFDANRSA